MIIYSTSYSTLPSFVCHMRVQYLCSSLTSVVRCFSFPWLSLVGMRCTLKTRHCFSDALKTLCVGLPYSGQISSLLPTHKPITVVQVHRRSLHTLSQKTLHWVWGWELMDRHSQASICPCSWWKAQLLIQSEQLSSKEADGQRSISQLQSTD